MAPGAAAARAGDPELGPQAGGQQPRGASHHPPDRKAPRLGRGAPIRSTSARKVDRLPQPGAVVTLLVQRYAIALLKRHCPPVVADRQSRLLISPSQHPERMLVKAEPDVQAVLVDALSTTAVATQVRGSAAGSLTPELPTALIDSDLEAPAQRRGRRQTPGGGQSAAAASQDRDLGSAAGLR